VSGSGDEGQWFPDHENFRFLCEECGVLVDAQWMGAGFLFAHECYACGRHQAHARSYDAVRARAKQEEIYGHAGRKQDAKK